MPRYIALLRGINVGGNNKVPMPELKTLYEQQGFYDVVTYINSGNILFSTEETDEMRIKAECKEMISQHFQLDIPVTIAAVQDLNEALDHAPAWWNHDEESKHNAIFVIPPTTVEEVLDAVGAAKPEYEKVDYHGRVIFWSAPLKTFSRTRWSKVAGTSLYNSITIRNANTVLKLAKLGKQNEE